MYINTAMAMMKSAVMIYIFSKIDIILKNNANNNNPLAMRISVIILRKCLFVCYTRVLGFEEKDWQYCNGAIP